jgi:hypothetical protein
MENHKFKKVSYLSVCGICFKPLLHEYHLDNLDPSDIKPKDPKIEDKNNDFKLTEDTKIYEGIDRKPPLNPNSNEPLCYGHTCPSCGISYLHNYKCWPDPKMTASHHCSACFGQAIVEIHRAADIAGLIQVSETFTARDQRELRIQHKGFCVLEMSKTEEYEEWSKKHQQQLEDFIKMANVKKFANREALLERRKEDGAKLTDEEITDYRRRAARQKKVKADSESSDKKKQWKEQNKNLASIVGKDAAEIKLRELWKSQGKEIPEN